MFPLDWFDVISIFCNTTSHKWFQAFSVISYPGQDDCTVCLRVSCSIALHNLLAGTAGWSSKRAGMVHSFKGATRHLAATNFTLICPGGLSLIKYAHVPKAPCDASVTPHKVGGLTAFCGQSISRTTHHSIAPFLGNITTISLVH